MHKLAALLLMFDCRKLTTPGLIFLLYTNHGLCTIWLHSNRNEEYIRSILIVSSDNVISRTEPPRRLSNRGYTAKPSKLKARSHGFVKTPAEQNCMAKSGENKCNSLHSVCPEHRPCLYLVLPFYRTINEYIHLAVHISIPVGTLFQKICWGTTAIFDPQIL